MPRPKFFQQKFALRFYSRLTELNRFIHFALSHARNILFYSRLHHTTELSYPREGLCFRPENFALLISTYRSDYKLVKHNLSHSHSFGETHS